MSLKLFATIVLPFYFFKIISYSFIAILIKRCVMVCLVYMLYCLDEQKKGL